MKSSFAAIAALFAGAIVIATAGQFVGSASGEAKDKEPADVARARREVKMLDDLYKTAVVAINDTYVTDESSVAAGQAARVVFGAMREKGWHDARLIDATGKPVNDDNVAKDAFEKSAIEKIKKGETFVETVEKGDDGKTYFRAATVVPAVNAKCILCHPGFKVGDVLGAIGYKLPLSE